MPLTPISAEPDFMQELKAQYDQSAFAPVVAPNELPPGPHRYFGYGLGMDAEIAAAAENAENVAAAAGATMAQRDAAGNVAARQYGFVPPPGTAYPIDAGGAGANPQFSPALAPVVVPAPKKSWVTPAVIVAGGALLVGAIYLLTRRK
jgi:hypothetical protein